MISFNCSCGHRLNAKDEHAGRRAKCPSCETIVKIPAPPAPEFDEDLGDDKPYELAESPQKDWSPAEPLTKAKPPSMSFKPVGERTKPAESSSSLEENPWKTAAPDLARSGSYKKKPKKKGWTPDQPESSVRDMVYWVFIFALIPLAASILGGEGAKVEVRLEKTLDQLPEAQAVQVERMMEDEETDIGQIMAMLPNNKIDDNAHLPYTTYVHWIYAAISAALFLTVLSCLFSSGSAPPFSLLQVAAFTSTMGILLLMILQFFAGIAGGFRMIRGRGLVMVILLIVMLIGFSYQAALDPSNGFWLSMLGFTFGVGLCEEACKALPLLWHFRDKAAMGWRGACLWGLASGVGFGVAEGVLYSSNHYNGVATLNTYLVRFLSCVALHAMWSGAVGITLEKNQENVQMEWDEDFFSSLMGLLRVLAVPMVLHGLYDTLLKKDMDLYALGVAIVTFAWFAGTIEAAKRGEERDEFAYA